MKNVRTPLRRIKCKKERERERVIKIKKEKYTQNQAAVTGSIKLIKSERRSITVHVMCVVHCVEIKKEKCSTTCRDRWTFFFTFIYFFYFYQTFFLYFLALNLPTTLLQLIQNYYG